LVICSSSSGIFTEVIFDVRMLDVVGGGGGGCAVTIVDIVGVVNIVGVVVCYCIR